jgi:acetylornithine deacetylase/succinyl-diaminopimelate desuccinylase-like protein
MRTTHRFLRAAALCPLLAIRAHASAAPDYDALAASARATLAAMIETDTSNPPGNEARIVTLVAKRLKDAGVPYEITEFEPGRKNIVARLKGAGPEKPLMLLAHIDVVGADGQAWTFPPHKLTEKDGFLYGRGTGDMLGMAAINLETFLDLKRSGAPLRRDVILAMTGDEESGGKGIRYVLEHAPKSIDAGFVLNEGGKPSLGDDGKVRYVSLVGAEKIYEDFELVAKGKTGHSSVPLDDNAIYRLSDALSRLGRFKFPARLLPVTRAYFAARAAIEKPEIAAAMSALAASTGELPTGAVKTIDAEPLLMPSLHTTCVATLLSAGTRVNALPAEAKATVNCRVLPDETLEQVRAVLAGVIADPAVEIRPVDPFARAAPAPGEGAANEAG